MIDGSLGIVIIGGGGVAEAFVRVLSGAGLVPVQVWTRRDYAPRELAGADLYIMAVTDGAIGELSASLPFAPGSVVAHTAGGVSIDALDERIEHRAVIYPLQTFTRGRVPCDFPVFVEGTTAHALAVALRVAGALSNDVREMSSERRARLHLAAVVANNFTNAMLSWSEALASAAGEDFDPLRPLVAETFAKALEMSPGGAQTGPARRGDKAVMDKHLALLPADEAELYKRVSELIWKISKKN